MQKIEEGTTTPSRRPLPLLSVRSNKPIICNYQAKTSDDLIKKHFFPLLHNPLIGSVFRKQRSLAGKLFGKQAQREETLIDSTNTREKFDSFSVGGAVGGH